MSTAVWVEDSEVWGKKTKTKNHLAYKCQDKSVPVSAGAFNAANHFISPGRWRKGDITAFLPFCVIAAAPLHCNHNSLSHWLPVCVCVCVVMKAPGAQLIGLSYCALGAQRV